MKYYFAPLEGITDATFRSLHHKYFPGIDRYYMPFMSPTVHRSLTPREAEIITLRYGLDGRPPRTQRETAKLCAISRSYVSRIEKKALEKLREALGEDAKPV